MLVLVGIPLLLGGCQTQAPVWTATNTEGRTSERPPIVVVTDVGAEMDDQWALAHLLLSPELNVRAIITTHAALIQLSPATSHQKATEVLDRVRQEPALRPTVVQGADAPLKDIKAPQPSAGVDLLIRLSKEYLEPQRLIVVVIGAATEVASAILRDPSIVHRITVVAMGFEDWTTGGKEFNVRNDPEAWRVVLQSNVPLVIGSGALTKRDLRLTRDEAAALVGARGQIGKYLYELFDDWLTRQAALVAQVVAPATWVIWDEVVVAYVLDMAAGDERPRPRLEADLTFSHPETPQRITWLTRIDGDRLWDDFTRKIDARR